jgi:hypothetical protein
VDVLTRNPRKYPCITSGDVSMLDQLNVTEVDVTESGSTVTSLGLAEGTVGTDLSTKHLL